MAFRDRVAGPLTNSQYQWSDTIEKPSLGVHRTRGENSSRLRMKAKNKFFESRPVETTTDHARAVV